MTEPLPLALSVAVARSYSGLARDHLYDLMNSGAVASIARGRRRLVVRESLERWIREESGRRSV